MISSLAHFFMLIFYNGMYSASVNWTLLMYTMGAVSVARIAIEQDRTYSLGYLGALGLAAFVVMLGSLQGSPIFVAGILALIAYLADRITRDCTMIDDSVDASGQGLIDFGSSKLREQLAANEKAATTENAVGHDTAEASETDVVHVPKAKKKTHQPGRTVMYLALGALPLFGIGQFLLRSDSLTWGSAQKHLAIYLFSSLSLLVATSFLGLRRYLRQRRVDMPNDVSFAWLAGGLALIALILGIAYMAPMPGRALASFEIPQMLKSRQGRQASENGWGDEAAEKSKPGASKTSNDPRQAGKESEGAKSQKGAQPGAADKGNNDKGSPGSESGGKQKGGNQQGKQQGGDKQGKQPGQKQNGPKQDGQKQGKQNGGKQQGKQSGQSKQQSQQKSQQGKNQNQGSKSESQEGNQKSDAQKSDAQQGGEKGQPKKSPDGKSGEKQSPKKQPSQDKPKQKDSQSKSESNSESKSENKSDDNSAESNSSSSGGSSSSPGSSIAETAGSLVGALGGIIKFLIMIGLFAVVAAFVYLNRNALAEWWNRLWDRESRLDAEVSSQTTADAPASPVRPFASFRNPIGKENDPRKVIVITFQAFEAWTREQGWQRGHEETPSEFMRRIAASIPQVATPATEIVNAYNRIVYGRGKATRADMTAADQVWRAMRAS